MSFLLHAVIRRTWLRFLGLLAPTYHKYDSAPAPCEIAGSDDVSPQSRRTLMNSPD